MSPLTAMAGTGASAALRKDTPSACSSRTVVASVNGRRPPSTFSSVERLSLASSANDCREMRRRAISSRIVSAICRLCSAESCLSGVGIVTPVRPVGVVYQTHNPSQTRTKPSPRRRIPAGQWLNNADHSARATRAVTGDFPNDEHVARE